MAKKAIRRRASTRAAPAPSRAKNGFSVLAMHITEASGRRLFAALKADQPAHSVFSGVASQPRNLDPESAAKRILEHALASKKMPMFNPPEIRGADGDFKSLGVETVS